MTLQSDRTPVARAERVARSLEWLRRYEPLLDDADAFRAALDEPPPTDLFALPGRLGADALEASLASRGLGTSRFAFAPHHVRVTGHVGAGTIPEVVLGLAFPQGVSSAIGPQALAPVAGERVIDMCAAPGGKTVLLDALAGGACPILAGEPSAGRAGILVQTLARCGAVGGIVVQQDGQNFPVVSATDAILLDAPCTGEGTFRVPSPRFDVRGPEGPADVSGLQRRLLARALQLLAPGGRLIYSTCAYAPEENEAVLHDVLASRDDTAIVDLPAGTPGLPGLRSWDGQVFRDDVERARRILPHHFGSWGFFVALLAKSPDATRTARRRYRHGPPAPDAPVPVRDDPAARELVSAHARKIYGLAPDALDDVMFVARGRDVFAAPRVAALMELERLHLVSPGLRFLHRTGKSSVQLTNAALRWLGPRIAEHTIDIDMETAASLLVDGPRAVPGARNAMGLAVRVGGIVVAKGHVEGGELALEIPTGWR